ncbi:MAG: radical SAM protein [Victivallaceae bacterium]|nr:radical SAM protein [Victivallaceae bacterium]
MPEYKEPLFRPPAEADSLIFQVAYGCPHNTCRFCGMYKGVRYSLRGMEEALAEFIKSAEYYPEARRIFLADGDVMLLPFAMLKTYLVALNSLFPRLTRVNVYANGSSILDKSDEELAELKKLRLNTLYLGLETGSPKILELVNKGEKVNVMIEAVKRAQQHGLRCSVMFLLGLGGKEYSAEHVRLTAAALNEMQPILLSALRFVEVPNTRMFDGFKTVSEYEAVKELRDIIAGLELRKTIFRANHRSNPIPLEGRFPNNKQDLLDLLDAQLASGELDKNGPGMTPLFL